MTENERQAVKLGDGVYVLGYDEKKKRPRLNVYDPGSYFPVFDERLQGAEDFPKKVYIAYEFCEWESNKKEYVTYVRRIVWNLISVGEEIGMAPAFTPGYDMGDEGTPEFNCKYEDAIWTLDQIEKDLGSFNGPPVYLTEPVFLDIDYIPVIHIPNTVALQIHYGRSVMMNVLQILDDLQSTDTDLQAASATTGSPPLAIEGRAMGGNNDIDTYGPGQIFYVGEGKATLIDTSASLDALIKLKDALLNRLSVNGRIPESLLGRVKPSEVPSGITLTLSFAPPSSMVRELRNVRKEQYPILLKFVLRWLQKAGKIKAGALPKANIVFGSFLPADKEEAVTLAVQLLNSKAASLETVVKMLMSAGIDIDDWVKEIERIESRDFDGANAMFTLTGEVNEALKYMHRPELKDPAQQGIMDNQANPPAPVVAPPAPAPKASQP